MSRVGSTRSVHSRCPQRSDIKISSINPKEEDDSSSDDDSDCDDNDSYNDPLTSRAVHNKKRRHRVYLFSFREILSEVFRRYLAHVLETRGNQQPGGVGFENLTNLLIAEIEFGFWSPDSSMEMALDLRQKHQISKCQPLYLSESEKYMSEQNRLIEDNGFKKAPCPNADQTFIMGCWENYMTNEINIWEKRPTDTEPCLPIVHPSKKRKLPSVCPPVYLFALSLSLSLLTLLFCLFFVLGYRWFNDERLNNDPETVHVNGEEAFPSNRVILHHLNIPFSQPFDNWFSYERHAVIDAMER